MGCGPKTVRLTTNDETQGAKHVNSDVGTNHRRHVQSGHLDSENAGRFARDGWFVGSDILQIEQEAD